jgi:uncharacterized protein YbcI
VDSSSARGGEGRHGEALARITTETARLYSEYYGGGPTGAKSYLLDDAYVVTVLRAMVTTVERTLAGTGHGDQVRAVRLTFQEALAETFKAVVEEALSRHVVSYQSQLLIDADIGFEMLVLD